MKGRYPVKVISKKGEKFLVFLLPNSCILDLRVGILEALKSGYKKTLKEAELELFDKEGFKVTKDFSENVKISKVFKGEPVIINYPNENCVIEQEGDFEPRALTFYEHNPSSARFNHMFSGF